MTIEKAFKVLLIKSPFYGLFALGLPRKETTKVDTLAVSRKGINCELLINPDFWSKFTDEEQIALLTHELMHICFQHMFMVESFQNEELFNYSADLEVNGYIENIPKGALLPQDFGFDRCKGTKYYYEQLQKQQQSESDNDSEESDNGSNSSNSGNSDSDSNDNTGSSRGNLQTLDDHSNWSKEFNQISEAEQTLVKNQIDSQIKVAAEQVEKSRGTIPAELQAKVEELFKVKPRVFDWKQYFRRMLGTIYDINLRSTRRKKSYRFPDASGIIHKKKVSIMVAIDTSGSVSDKELCDFFSEITHIYKAGARITIVECDADIQRIYEYNGKWDMTCNGRGGTDFSPVIDYYNKVRKDYSALIYFTDGECNIPDNCPKDMIWVITSNGYHDQEYPGKALFIPKENESKLYKKNPYST